MKKKICIVGYGSHVKNTIIPSLNMNSNNIKIITKKKISRFETFENLDLAFKKLSKDYIFFNSTPPKFHFKITKLILSAGFNVIVEKPLCLNVYQLKKLYDLAKKKNLFVFENMMYFHSLQFEIFKKLFVKKDVKEIEINFSIPIFNQSSFRSENKIESSILYDIGCYPFSFISYFGFMLRDYKIYSLKKNKKINYIEILFFSKNIKFKIIISVYRKYKNYIKLVFDDCSSACFNHFFYGKKKNKVNYFYSKNKIIKILNINEDNIFKNILNFSNKKLRSSSKDQYLITKNYLKSLNLIMKKLNYGSY